MNLILYFFNSPILKYIYDFEDIENSSIIRIRNQIGDFGLYYRHKYCIKELLYPMYSSIESCDEGIYICCRNNKFGVYNANLKDWVVPIEFDNIKIHSREIFEVSKGPYKKAAFTSKGEDVSFRIFQSNKKLSSQLRQ